MTQEAVEARAQTLSLEIVSNSSDLFVTALRTLPEGIRPSSFEIGFAAVSPSPGKFDPDRKFFQIAEQKGVVPTEFLREEWDKDSETFKPSLSLTGGLTTDMSPAESAEEVTRAVMEGRIPNVVTYVASSDAKGTAFRKFVNGELNFILLKRTYRLTRALLTLVSPEMDDIAFAVLGIKDGKQQISLSSTASTDNPSVQALRQWSSELSQRFSH